MTSLRFWNGSARRCAARAPIRVAALARPTAVHCVTRPRDSGRSRLRPGVRGGLGTPVKAVLRKLMRWYVEPVAYDQRSFNAVALRLIDDLDGRLSRIETELSALRGEAAKL